MFTACQGSESESDGPGFPNGDVLLFPDMIRYRFDSISSSSFLQMVILDLKNCDVSLD